MNKSIFHLIKWDFLFFLRYQIITVAAVIAGLYSIILGLLPDNSDTFLILIIFSDPTFLGFLFIGVIVLYEKSSNTIQALSITPARLGNYMISKSMVLTFIAIFAAMFMAVSSKGFQFNSGYLLLAVILSSVLFILLGFVGISKVKTFNQYILVIPMFFVPAVLPLLEMFGFISSPVFYIIPTKASLLLFEAAFGRISFSEFVYCIVYLSAWIVFSYKWAYKAMRLNWKNQSS
jgi:fluoroquinolone transport system permease protein